MEITYDIPIIDCTNTYVWYDGDDNPYILVSREYIETSKYVDILGNPIIKWSEYKNTNPYLYFYDRNPIIPFINYMDTITDSKMRKIMDIPEHNNDYYCTIADILYNAGVNCEYICDGIFLYRDRGVFSRIKRVAK